LPLAEVIANCEIEAKATAHAKALYAHYLTVREGLRKQARARCGRGGTAAGQRKQKAVEVEAADCDARELHVNAVPLVLTKAEEATILQSLGKSAVRARRSTATYTNASVAANAAELLQSPAAAERMQPTRRHTFCPAGLPGQRRIDTSAAQTLSLSQAKLPQDVFGRLLAQEEQEGRDGAVSAEAAAQVDRETQRAAQAENQAALAAQNIEAVMHAPGDRAAQERWADSKRLQLLSPADVDDQDLAKAVRCLGGNAAARAAKTPSLAVALRGRRIDVFLPEFVQWVAAEVLRVQRSRADVLFWCDSRH
jgi:hypothetical protein